MNSLEELARFVEAMRRLQSEYFRTRSNNVLRDCRDMERRVDQRIKEILHPAAPALPFEE